MEDREKDSQPIEESDVFQETPVESPSENYMVVEHLQRMPNIFSRGLLYLVVLFLLSGLIYSLVSEIDVVVECRAVARPDSQPIEVIADRNGTIERIFITEGQAVEKNTPLYAIHPTEQNANLSEYEERRPSDPINETFSSGERNGKREIIIAGHAGTVSKLYFRNVGEFVRKSDLLCSILPMNAPLYMDITVANKDIGFIETGMDIKYKFDAFPYMDCGVILGKVLAISPSAVEDRTLGLVYHLRGSLDTTCFDIREKTYPLKAGMTATAELVTGKKSIFSILFKKLKG